MEEKNNKKSIMEVDFISEEKKNILKKDNVKTLGQLANKTKTDLKKYGFESNDIKKIDIELQLLGLSLKEKNKY